MADVGAPHHHVRSQISYEPGQKHSRPGSWATSE